MILADNLSASPLYILAFMVIIGTVILVGQFLGAAFSWMLRLIKRRRKFKLEP